MEWSGSQDGNFFRFLAAQHDIGRADSDVQRAGKLGLPNYLDAFSNPETQRGKAVRQASVGVNRGDGRGFAWF